MNDSKRARLMPVLKGLAAATALTLTSSLALAKDVAHDQIWAIGELAGKTAKTFHPPIGIESGCVPHAAVNWEGDKNAGLKPTGGYSSDCGAVPRGGNTYYRMFEEYGGYCAIAYTWYMPKDAHIHRHDWEMAIVWLNSKYCSHDAAVQKLSVTRHGKLYHHDPQYLSYSGKAPKVRYFMDTPTHGLSTGGNQAGFIKPTLVNFDRLPTAAKNTLTSSWGSAVFPLGDNKIWGWLDRSYKNKE